MVARYSLDDGGRVAPADQQSNPADAAKAANTKSSDSFTVQRSGLNVRTNAVYPFSFAYLYEDPDNPSQQIMGPRSPNFLFTLQTPDLTQPVTNLVVTPGLLSYGVKWDLIDKALPANKWLIDIQIYESLTGAFSGEEYLVWNGNGNSATILVSNTANRWIRVDTRDQDYRKKSVVFGPFKATDPIVVDTTGPANVTSVTIAESGIDTSGYLGFNAYANISWPAVTGGGIRGYRIRFSNDNGATYSYVDSPGTGTTYKLAGLAIGSTYQVAVATYDEYNNTSSSYVSGPNVTVAGTPSVSNYISGGPFQFGVGVGSVSTNKGLYFDASNYWYVNATNSARLKVGGATSNYLLWDGSTFAIDGNVTARGGTFSGNIFMSTTGASIYNGTIDSATGNLTGNGFALNSTGLKVANGTKSVTISAATGTITANGGSIGNWNITDTTLSKNNIILDSAGTIQVGSTAAASVYLKSSGDFVMWAGNNTPDANAKFRIGSDGTLYANGAVFGTGTSISGYATTTQLGTTNTNLATTNSNLATTNSNLATTNSNLATTNSNLATTNTNLATKLTKSSNTITDSNNNMTAINAGGITVYSGAASNTGARVVMNSEGIAGYNSSNQPTFSVLASTGAATFAGTLSAATGTIGKVTFGTDNTSNFFETGSTLGGVSTGGISVGAIGFKNTSVGGWTTHCYPYMPGAPNIDLGTRSFRWNDVRISGNLMVGHDGSSNDDNGTTVKIKLLPNGNIYANALGTATTANFITQASGFLRVNTSSSRRYKTDIVDIDSVDSLNPESLLNIPVRAFKYNSDHLSESDQRFGVMMPGFIAEEVELVYPSAVDYNDDGTPERWNTNMIIPGMLSLIQKQNLQIESLKQRLDALEG
jgi:hypothetical protein